MRWRWAIWVNLMKFIVIQDRTKFCQITYQYWDFFLAFIVYGAFKHKSSIPPILTILVSGVFSILGPFTFLLSFFSAFLLSFFSSFLFVVVIPLKTERFTKGARASLGDREICADGVWSPTQTMNELWPLSHCCCPTKAMNIAMYTMEITICTADPRTRERQGQICAATILFCRKA